MIGYDGQRKDFSNYHEIFLGNPLATFWSEILHKERFFIIYDIHKFPDARSRYYLLRAWQKD